MELSLAKIKVLDQDAVDPGRGLPAEFQVRFNPTELTFAKAAQIAEINIPGIDSPILQFIRGQNEKLTLDLLFDTSDSGMDAGAKDVRELTKPFYQLVKIQPKTHAVPRIEFSWGKIAFKAIVDSFQQKFELFSPEGVPLRATVSLSLREYRTLEEQVKDLKFESADHTKRRIVRRGDTLSRISFEEYRDPREWRVIADANGDVLESPARLEPGIVLVIPPIDLVDARGPEDR